jgi:hypothetical protein
MDTKSIECFGTDPRARGLRVELSSHESLVLPHEHFMYSELKAGAEYDMLKLFFMNHEVSLTGYGLRRVESAMQTRDLAWVTARSARHRSLGSEKGFITQISIQRLGEEEGANAVQRHLHD